LRGSTATIVNASDQISGFSYDADGNNTVNTNHTLGYNIDDNQTSCDTTTYGYWSDGTRAWKLLSGGTKQYFLYDGGDMVAELDNTLVPSFIYVFGANGITAKLIGSTAAMGRSYAFDPLGNLCQRFQYSSNLLVSDTFYDAYGSKITDITESNGNIFPSSDWVGYKGRYGYYTDNESGLLYCHARYYSPALDRWLSRDPTCLEGGLNPYDYCNGNPVTHVDPSGYESLIITS